MDKPLRAVNKQTGETLILEGGKWVPEPAPESASAPRIDMGGQAPAPTAPEPSTRRFAEAPGSTGDNLMQTARDAGRNLYEGVRGIGSGLAAGWDDEAAAAVQTGLGKLGPELPGGNSYESNLRQQSADKAEGQAFSAQQNDQVGLEALPSANTFGQVAGSAIGAKGTSAALKGGTAATRLTSSAAAQGAVQGAGDATPGSRLEGAGKGAVIGAALGQGAKLAGKGLSAAGRGAQRMLSPEQIASLQAAADKARVRALGLNPGQVAREPGGVARQAETARKYGVGKGLFTGRQGMEDQAARGLEQASAGRAAIETAVPESAVISGQQVANPLVARAKKLSGAGVSDEAKEYLAKAKDVSSQPAVRRELRVTPVKPPRPSPEDAVTREMPPRKGPQPVYRNTLDRGELPEGVGPAPGRPTVPDMDGLSAEEKFALKATKDLKPRRGAQPYVPPLAPTVQADLPSGVGPRPGPPTAPPTPAPKREFVDVEYRAPRDLNLEQLREGRQFYAPDNWKNDTAPVRRKKDFWGAYAEGENALIERELPGRVGDYNLGPAARGLDPNTGAAQNYRVLGQDMQGLIEAQDGLANAGGASVRLPAGKIDALRQVGRSGWAANQTAKVREALPGAARWVAPAGRAAGAYAQRAGGAVQAASASPGASVLTRRLAANQESTEYPEDEYYQEFRNSPYSMLYKR